jgi:hypothetical protein
MGGEDELRLLLLITSYPKHLCWHGEPEVPTCDSIEKAMGRSRPPSDEDATLCGILFSHLFAASPDAVLKIMLNLRKLINTRSASPVFKIASWLWGQYTLLGKQWVFTDKAEAIADRAASELKCKVSPKVVEHARARLRKTNGWRIPTR